MLSEEFAVTVQTEPTHARTRVKIAGELDLTTVPQLRAALADARARTRSVILDLREVAFIDSSGIQAIVDALRAAQSDGHHLAVAPTLPAHVRRLFDLCGLTARLPVDES